VNAKKIINSDTWANILSTKVRRFGNEVGVKLGRSAKGEVGPLASGVESPTIACRVFKRCQKSVKFVNQEMRDWGANISSE
jgi:hypothetical protein